MFCPKCGANLIDGAEFCQKCGAQLKKKEEPVVQQEPIYSQPAAAPAAMAAPKRSKAPIIIAVCVVVVVLIVAIVAAAIAIPALKGGDSQAGADPGYGEYETNDSYENDDSSDSSDLPEFCGKYDRSVANATTYDNKYFGFKVDLDSSWSFYEDDEIEDLTGSVTKSSLDLSNLKYGSAFADMAAADYSGNAIMVSFYYLGNTAIDPFADYDGEDEFWADFLTGFYTDYTSDNGFYIDYSTYGDKTRIGGLDAVSAVVEYYYNGEQQYVQKDYFAIKGDVIIAVETLSYEYSDPSALASMFSAS